MKSFSHRAPVMGKEHYVRYGAVVGDYNPVHYDSETAGKFGLPAVISQGPLTFTLALDALAANVGLDNIKGFKSRATAPAFPGTEMTVSYDGEKSVLVTAGEKTFLEGTIETK